MTSRGHAAKKPSKKPAAKPKKVAARGGKDRERVVRSANRVKAESARAAKSTRTLRQEQHEREEKAEKLRKKGEKAAPPPEVAAKGEKVAKGDKAAPKGEKPGKGEKGPKLRKPARPYDEEQLEAEGAEATEEDDDDDDDDADELPADDMSDITERSEVKALMERGREKGFLTYDEVNDALPSDTSSDQIDDVMSMFGEHDIEVVDGAEKKMKLPDKPPEPEEKAEEKEEKEEEEDAGYGKSNDPVRMYLRKMGSVSLLTREGEVEIAKRIEVGEKEVLAAVLSSSIAIREILELGERLRKGKIRVREIVKDAGDEQAAEREEEEVEEETAEVRGRGRGRRRGRGAGRAGEAEDPEGGGEEGRARAEAHRPHPQARARGRRSSARPSPRRRCRR